MNLIKMFGLMSGLSGTYRFTNAKLIHQESVLEHLGMATLTAYLLTNEINGRGGNLDVGKVLSKAIVHDVEEVLMGDVPRVTKYSTVQMRELFRRAEEWAMDRVVAELDLDQDEEVKQNHHSAKKGAEGCVVELADVLAVVYKINAEVLERGNLTMVSRATSCGDQLRKMMAKFAVPPPDLEWNDATKNFVVDVISQALAVVHEAREKGRLAGCISEEAAE